VKQRVLHSTIIFILMCVIDYHFSDHTFD